MDLMLISGCAVIRGSTCGRQCGYALQGLRYPFQCTGGSAWTQESTLRTRDRLQARLLNRRLMIEACRGAGFVGAELARFG